MGSGLTWQVSPKALFEFGSRHNQFIFDHSLQFLFQSSYSLVEQLYKAYAICFFWKPKRIARRPNIQMVVCSCDLLEAGVLFRLCCLYEAPSNVFSFLRRSCAVRPELAHGSCSPGQIPTGISLSSPRSSFIALCSRSLYPRVLQPA